MNYSRAIKIKSIGNRILISWIIVAVIFGSIGGVIGGCIGHSTGKKAATEAKTESKVYGTYDGRTFTTEMSMDWASGDLDYVALDVPLDSGLQEFIFYLSTGYNIDYTLVLAMIEKESSYEADVISETNDYGLMQINECNSDYLSETIGVTDLLDPYQNVRSGLFILRQFFEKYETPEKVLMCYNMGENGAAILWEQGIYETNYVTDVLEIQQRLNAELEERKASND